MTVDGPKPTTDGAFHLRLLVGFGSEQVAYFGLEWVAGFQLESVAELDWNMQLISPQFVKPYVKTNKNDAADAEAICEAVARPNMGFLPVFKSIMSISE